MRKRRKPVNVQVGQSLRRIRTERGLTQTEVAKSIRIGRQSIATIEKGRQGVPIVLLQKMAAYYSVSMASILDGI